MKALASQGPVFLFLAGCSTAPAQNIFGSFFPAWMLCAVFGLLSAVAVRQVLYAVAISQYVIAPLLTYLCIAVAATFAYWLIWFGH